MGPTTADDRIVEELIKAGMNVARFNFSHGTHESQKEAIDRVNRVSEKCKIPVGILLDTKGPEIRTGNTSTDKNGTSTIEIKAGSKVKVTVDDCICTPENICVNWKDLPLKASKGVKILIADGLIELEVEDVNREKGEVYCVAKNGGKIGSKKNVNLIGLHAGLPIMSEQDKKDIAFGAKMGVDFIAASFVSFPEEVVEIRNYLEELGSSAKIIAKIENEEGVDNIDGIIEKADGVMVARGDLGVQLPTERIPLVQKYIIGKCRKAGKVVITATQMLDSMIVNPRPTRAELTDVANAVFDGTDAVMLSGETANGKYPVEAVQTMAKICQTVEESEEYRETVLEADDGIKPSEKNIGRAVSKTAYIMARDITATAIVIPTLSGTTARLVSQFRPEQTIIAATPKSECQRQLMLNWGVIPMSMEMADDSDEMVQKAVKAALDAKYISLGDKIVMLAGIPLANPLRVNTVKVLIVGNVVASGVSGCANPDLTKVSGKVFKVTDANEARPAIRKHGSIMVVKKLTEDYIPILRIINGVICESNEISEDLLKMVNPNLVWLSDAANAFTTLEHDETITIDVEKSLALEGLI